MEQTALRWFIDQLRNSTSINANEDINWHEFDKIAQQAIDKEKEQIVKAWIVRDIPSQRKYGELYYERTYNGYVDEADEI